MALSMKVILIAAVACFAAQASGCCLYDHCCEKSAWGPPQGFLACDRVLDYFPPHITNYEDIVESPHCHSNFVAVGSDGIHSCGYNHCGSRSCGCNPCGRKSCGYRPSGCY